ncbi:hypothetical protein ABVK25_011291 [Lepraria finkii]|uniref:Uncharacterized protein n=1 Tax=Lepraria finkii TaxID=1340010 RepID=A0ABR4AST9_9LECA
MNPTPATTSASPTEVPQHPKDHGRGTSKVISLLKGPQPNGGGAVGYGCTVM